MVTSAIPIENIYYLLCYAWDCLDERDLTAVTTTESMRLPELFGRVLVNGVTRTLKRGLDRSYVTFEGEIPGIRGRLDVAGSLKRATFMRARAWCAYDEFSTDVLHNRIVKATLRRLAAVEGLDATLADVLRELYRRLADVSDIVVTARHFAQVRLNRNNSYYRFLLCVCELVHRNLLISEQTGRVVFQDFTRDDNQMAALFEHFLFRFFQREQKTHSVAADKLRWQATGDADHLAFLPEMRTDLVLRSASDLIVMNAKFYTKTLAQNFDKSSVHQNHLFQLFAYLKNISPSAAGRSVRGMLVYPRTTRSVTVDVQLFEYPILAATIDLAQPWEGIHSDLLRLLSRGGGTHGLQ